MNIVASQISNFAPKRTAPSTPSTPGELISNGAFSESANGWTSKYGNGSIESISITARGAPAKLARVTDREDFCSGLYQDLGTNVKSGVNYS